MRDPHRLAFLQASVLKDYGELRNLLDIVGTAICRSNGARIERIFKEQEPEQTEKKIKASFEFNGEIIHFY